MDITIDLETIPTQKEGAYEAILAEVCANFKAPSTLTKEQAAIDLGLTDKDEIKLTGKDAMIKRWETELASVKAADVAEEKYRKTALSGASGEIVVIGFKFGDQKAESLSRGLGESESNLIEMFYKRLRSELTHTHGAFEQAKLIGHNIHGFDLRFLWQRSVINNIKPPIDLLFSQYSDKVFDTMTTWAGFGNRISLKDLCAALGVPSPKVEIDGSKVWDYVKDGRVDEVAAYCRDGDVEATYQCYQKMRFSMEKLAKLEADQPTPQPRPPLVFTRSPAPAAKPQTQPTLTLGTISERLGFTVSGAFLQSLGFESVKVKAASLYQEADFEPICRAIVSHIHEVCEVEHA